MDGGKEASRHVQCSVEAVLLNPEPFLVDRGSWLDLFWVPPADSAVGHSGEPETKVPPSHEFMYLFGVKYK